LLSKELAPVTRACSIILQREQATKNVSFVEGAIISKQLPVGRFIFLISWCCKWAEMAPRRFFAFVVVVVFPCYILQLHRFTKEGCFLSLFID